MIKQDYAEPTSSKQQAHRERRRENIKGGLQILAVGAYLGFLLAMGI